MIFKEIIHMNVNDIIWHVENFQNTWNGWNELLTGVLGFFEKLPNYIFGNGFEGAADGINGLSSVFK